MSLRSIIQKEIQRALSRGGYLDDIPEQVTYFSATQREEFDTETQESVIDSTGKTVDVVFGTYRADQIDGMNILPEDKPAYLSQLNATKAGISMPVQDDQLQDQAGSLWKCVRVLMDPAKAVYILQLRHP